MNKKFVIGIFILIVLVIGGFGIAKMFGQGNITGNAIKTNSPDKIKEFSIDSYTDIIDGKYYPKFSPKEITVNKGDIVKIKVNVKSGRHDFKIDEFNVYTDTPTNETTIIEFIADKTGEFVYYCAKPGHRQAGQWGTLKVLE